jgi:hypothetical protein
LLITRYSCRNRAASCRPSSRLAPFRARGSRLIYEYPRHRAGRIREIIDASRIPQPSFHLSRNVSVSAASFVALHQRAVISDFMMIKSSARPTSPTRLAYARLFAIIGNYVPVINGTLLHIQRISALDFRDRLSLQSIYMSIRIDCLQLQLYIGNDCGCTFGYEGELPLPKSGIWIRVKFMRSLREYSPRDRQGRNCATLPVQVRKMVQSLPVSPHECSVNINSNETAFTCIASAELEFTRDISVARVACDHEENRSVDSL